MLLTKFLLSRKFEESQTGSPLKKHFFSSSVNFNMGNFVECKRASNFASNQKCGLGKTNKYLRSDLSIFD
jgi:hypothetical protein